MYTLKKITKAHFLLINMLSIPVLLDASWAALSDEDCEKLERTFEACQDRCIKDTGINPGRESDIASPKYKNCEAAQCSSIRQKLSRECGRFQEEDAQ